MTKYINRRKIYLISDNTDTIKFTEKIYYGKGNCSVSSFNLSEDITGYLTCRTASVVILDTSEHKDKAVEILKELKKIRSCPILVLIKDVSVVEQYYKLGANDFLMYPFNEIEFIARVQHAIRTFNTINKITIRSDNLKQKCLILKRQKTTLSDEKIKSDKLLKNILPEEIATQLKNKGKVDTKKYRMVSILFTDFIDFTKLSASLKPQEIVTELGQFFTKFDDIVNKHYIEKIKTIGDAYMCVGGLPIRNKSNPIDTCLAALEMQYFVKQYNQTRSANNLPLWNLRLGIHTGKVVAGVIGRSKFAYDVWGDAVNTASRMETACEAGMVNISGETYKHVKDFFTCEYRGKLEAKNKGLIDMYYVHGLKPKYQQDGNPLESNQAFREAHSVY